MRKALYWASFPIEWLVAIVSGAARAVRFLVIVSNPLTLAIYLASRRKRHDPSDRA